MKYLLILMLLMAGCNPPQSAGPEVYPSAFSEESKRTDVELCTRFCYHLDCKPISVGSSLGEITCMCDNNQVYKFWSTTWVAPYPEDYKE